MANVLPPSSGCCAPCLPSTPSSALPSVPTAPAAGSGSPEGEVVGFQGKLYIDLDSGLLYGFHGSNNTTIGWGLLTGPINVQWFGADPTGAADSTLAIQAAIDFLPNAASLTDNLPLNSIGGGIYVPAGKYLYSALQIRTTDRGIRIFGDSKESSILHCTGAGVGINVEGTDAPSSFTKDITFAHLKFQSSNVNRPVGSRAISIKYLHYFEIDDCWFMGEDETAIYVLDAIDGHIHNCRFDTKNAGGRGYGYGIQCLRSSAASLGAANQITIGPQNYIEDTDIAAVFCREVEMIVVNDNLIQSNQRDGVNITKCNSVVVAHNYFEQNGQGDVAGDADIKSTGATGLSAAVSVLDNHHSGDGSTAQFFVVSLQDVRGANIERNDYRGGVAQEMNFGADCQSLTLRNNTAVVQPVFTIAAGIFPRAGNNRLRTDAFWTGLTDVENFYIQVPAFAASFTPDLRLGRVIKLGLTGDIVVNFPIGLIPPRLHWILKFTQDATGNRDVTFGAGFVVRNQARRGAGQVSVWQFFYDDDLGQMIQVGSAAAPGPKDENFLIHGNGSTGIIETSNITNGATKSSRFGSLHFNNSTEEPVWLVASSITASGNNTFIGGGLSTGNASTQINFYAAANSTTVQGTEVARLDFNAAAGNTRFLVYDVDTGILQRIKVGAAGSGPGGVGRALYFD